MDGLVVTANLSTIVNFKGCRGGGKICTPSNFLYITQAQGKTAKNYFLHKNTT